MRTLVPISGILVAASGGLVGLAGCGIGAGWMFWVGLIVFVVGWQIAYSAGKKTCPQCAEQVKVEALICNIVGTNFVLCELHRRRRSR